MKKFDFVLTVLFLLSFGITSCNDDDILDDPNFISSRINEVDWNGTPEISINHVNDTLTVLGYGDGQVVFFKIKFVGKGIYNISGNQASYYTSVGGDIITSLYILGESNNSQISVTDFDSEQNIIRGNFQLSLQQDWSNPENNVETLNFTNGKFKGIINN